MLLILNLKQKIIILKQIILFKYLKEAGNMDTQEYLWNKYFHLKHNNHYKYKRNGFSFNYELETDGYGQFKNKVFKFINIAEAILINDLGVYEQVATPRVLH